MTKPIFRLRGRSDKSVSFPTIRMQRHIGQHSGFQFKHKNKFFFKKNASAELECVNSVQADVELVESISSTSDEPSMLQGNKKVDKTETNTNKESNKMEANTEDHGAGQEKQAKKILSGSE